SDSSFVKLLSLDGLAQAGRFERGAFTAATLVGFERRRARVQATFAPPGWGGLVVRVVWSLDAPREAIDVLVQVSATSVGELRALEVMVLSQPGGVPGKQPTVPASRVEARDASSAALS